MLRGQVAVLPDRQHRPQKRQHHRAHADRVDEVCFCRRAQPRGNPRAREPRADPDASRRDWEPRAHPGVLRPAGSSASKEEHHGGAECRQQRNDPDMFEKEPAAISFQPSACRYLPWSPLQQVHFVHIHGFLVAEEGDHNAKPHGGLRRRVGNHENRKNLPVQVLEPRKRHQIQVDRIQDQLNGHQNDDHIAARHHADHADDEQRRRDNQVMQCVIGSIARLAPKPSRLTSDLCLYLFFAMTTAPTIATSSSSDAISNGSKYS